MKHAGPSRAEERGSQADAMRARFIAGDPIRGGAAMIVFTFHVALAALFITGFEFNAAAYREAFGPVAAKVLDNAELAVYAFFVLSGYLIGRPFVQAFLGHRKAPRLDHYTRRRVMRILPAFWIVVTITLIRFGSIDASFAEVIGIFGLVHTYDLTPGTLNVGVLGQVWTVHVEMAFYLLLPVAAAGLTLLGARRLDRRGRFAVLFVALLGAALASLAIRHALPQQLPYVRWVPSLMFAFVPGVALAALETVIPHAAAGRAWARRTALGLAVLGLAFCLAFTEFRLRSVAITGALAALGTASLVAAALLQQWSTGRCWRLLDNRPLHWLGQRSYSFYLVHVPILWELQLRLDSSVNDPWLAFVLLFALAFSASAALGHLGFRYVERPCLEMERWPWQRQPALTGEARVPGAAVAGDVRVPDAASARATALARER